MIRILAPIWMAIENGIGDVMGWALFLIFAGYVIWLMGDAGSDGTRRESEAHQRHSESDQEDLFVPDSGGARAGEEDRK